MRAGVRERIASTRWPGSSAGRSDVGFMELPTRFIVSREMVAPPRETMNQISPVTHEFRLTLRRRRLTITVFDRRGDVSEAVTPQASHDELLAEPAPVPHRRHRQPAASGLAARPASGLPGRENDA